MLQTRAAQAHTAKLIMSKRSMQTHGYRHGLLGQRMYHSLAGRSASVSLSTSALPLSSPLPSSIAIATSPLSSFHTRSYTSIGLNKDHGVAKTPLRPVSAPFTLPAASFSSSSSANSPSNLDSSSSPPSSSHSLSSFASFVRTRYPSLYSFILRMAGRRPPKGWERFFPPNRPSSSSSSSGASGTGSGNNSAGPKQPSGSGAADREQVGDKSKGEGSTGGPGGRRPSEPETPDWLSKILPFLIGLAFIYVTAPDSAALEQKQSKELTYQEFKAQFLQTGKVERLEVDVGSKMVRVFLKEDSESGSDMHMSQRGDEQSSERRAGSLSDVPPSRFQEDRDFSEQGKHRDSRSRSASRYHFYIGSVDAFERTLIDDQRDLQTPPADYVSVRYINPTEPSQFGSIITTLLLYGVSFWLIMRFTGMGGRGGGLFGGGKGGRSSNPFSFGKSTATLIKPGESKVTFDDVAGLDEAKVEVLEFVKFLQDPERFTKLGAKIPKGALLCGPPGTGKTLLAKAVAGEANVPFYSISGSDFLEMFVGVGPSRVRDLFSQARSNSPSIIFIDEIDAVGRARSARNMGGGNDERENTLNQLLVEMDGMNTTEGVVVLAGTNRKDMLDKALLRPGRFDRHITIDKPDIRGRAQIFKVHLKKLTLGEKYTIEELSQRLAALTPGMAGADIANLVNEAALIAARAEKDAVELSDFEKASDRILGGVEKQHSTMTKEEKALVAHHEAGHAVAAWFLEHADPLLKVTIVPRGNGALGFAQYLPKELSLYHQQQLMDMMAMALGGRAAEQLFFGRVSTGASDDLQKVTRIAQAQVTAYGMSDRLGNVSYAPGQDDNQFVKPYSEATAQAIDEEVRALVSKTYDRVLELLTKHKDHVAKLASRLIEIENVNHDALVEILGPRPFQTDAYIQWKKHAEENAQLIKKKEEEKKKKEQEQQANEETDDENLQPA